MELSTADEYIKAELLKNKSKIDFIICVDLRILLKDMKSSKIIPLVIYCVLWNFHSSAQMLLNEKFNDTSFLANWKISSNVEHAYLIGNENSRFVRFHPKYQREFIQSPSIPVSSSQYYALVFDWNEAQNSYSDSVQVQTSNDNGLTWKIIYSITKGNNRLWQTDSVSLGFLASGSNISLKWLYYSSGIFPSQFFNLDNIRLVSIGTPTSIKINENYLSAFIYPNPARNNFYLQLKNVLSKAPTLKIISTTGAVIRKMSLPELPNSISEIDVSHLEKGNYIIQIETDEHQDSHSLLIQ